MIKLYDVITGKLVASFKRSHDADFFKNAYNSNSQDDEIDFFNELTSLAQESVRIREACQEASNYLNDSQFTLEEQVCAIINKHDEGMPEFVIDYLSMVQVAEKFEGLFTAREFLTQIGYL